MDFSGLNKNLCENYYEDITSQNMSSAHSSVQGTNPPKIKTKAYINPHIINYENIKESLDKNSLFKTNKIHFNPKFKRNRIDCLQNSKEGQVPLISDAHLPSVIEKQGIEKRNKINLKQYPTVSSKANYRKSASQYKVVNNILKNYSHTNQTTWIKKNIENNFSAKTLPHFSNKKFLHLNTQKNSTENKFKNSYVQNKFYSLASNKPLKLSSFSEHTLHEKKDLPRYVSKTKVINSNTKKVINNANIKSKSNEAKVISPLKVCNNQSKYNYSETKLIMKVASSVKNKYKLSRVGNNLKNSKYKIDKRHNKVLENPKLGFIKINDISKLFPATPKPKPLQLNLKSLKRSSYSTKICTLSWRKSLKHNNGFINKTRNCTSRKIVKIGGIIYKSTSNKLIRTKDSKKGDIKLSNNLRETNKKVKKNHHIVYVRGEKFYLDKNGKTLIRQTNDSPNYKTSFNFKRIDIGGVTYLQKSKNMLIKTNVHQARHIVNSAKNKSIATLCQLKKRSAQPCMIYYRFGKCNRHNKNLCMYKHDPKNISICKKFLMGNCLNSNCLLSHEVIQEKMATCHFYLNGSCNRDNCPYLHVKLSSNAGICENFLQGFCDLAQNCSKRHLFQCPEFDKHGKCALGSKCPYPHKPKITISESSSGVETTNENVQYHTRKCQSLPKIKERKSKQSFVKVKNSFNQKLKKYKKDKKKLNLLPSCSTDNSNATLECVPKRIKLDQLPSFIPLKSDESNL